MIRDRHSKALIETDVAELRKYRSQKKKDREFQEIKKDVHELRDCINKICERIQKIEAKL